MRSLFRVRGGSGSGGPTLIKWLCSGGLVVAFAAAAQSPPANNPPPGTSSASVVSNALAASRSRASLNLAQAGTNSPPRYPGAAAVLTDAGPHHRIWTTQGGGTNQGTWRDRGQGKIVERASGLNYQDGQVWRRSQAFFELAADGFDATKVQHRVHLAGDLAQVGSVTTSLPDGTVLSSTPVAIGLFDAASGQTAILATVTNCAGALVSSNEVLYSGAFNGNGVQASVLYTIRIGSLSQDVVLTAPLNVADYGFPAATTRIQIYTECYGTNHPQRIVMPIRIEQNQTVRNSMANPDFMDQTLGFGPLVLAHGRAYLAIPGQSGTNRLGSAPVGKEFRTIDGRNFIIESVECTSVRAALHAMNDSLPKPVYASTSPARKPSAHYASIPPLLIRNPQQPHGSGEKALPIPQRADARLSKPNGLYIDYVAELGGSIDEALVLPGDATVFVSSPLYCNGPLTVEGGVVVKYPPTGNEDGDYGTFIQVNNSFTLTTSDYRPAIFTAGDDDTVGNSLFHVIDPDTGNYVYPGYTGVVQGSVYGAPDLYFASYIPSMDLRNVRFCWASQAVLIGAFYGTDARVTHCQLLNCLIGVGVSGSDARISANNCLFANVATLFDEQNSGGWDGNWNMCNCTVTNCAQLLNPGNYSSMESVTCLNSIFSGCGDLSAPYLSADYNGFDSSTPPFGDDTITDDQPPFAPTGYLDGGGQWHIYFANGQGAYYLRDGSPFSNAGSTTSVDPALLSDLKGRTTVVPDFLDSDFNHSGTIGPTPIRDAGPSVALGYHYPAVDYVIRGATVNNCTLNIDPGTVLALEGIPPDDNNIEWGFRLNPGGRLNVNGVPTNRVVFAHLEAIQEAPIWVFAPRGPVLTWRNIFFYPGAPATPYAEVKVLYADFPSLAGSYNAQIDSSDIDQGVSYSVVQTLTLDGCLFQGGLVSYDDGGPAGRSASVRDTVFERCNLWMGNNGGYESYSGLPAYGANLAVYNNLFYCDQVLLYPVDGSAWMFTDNIFDNVSFVDLFGGYTLNGPVGMNQYNTYVNMATHLAPPPSPSHDVDLPSLAYATGALGRFYLPATATSLIHTGSRSAALAGLYHFTSFSNNTKELGNTVSRGPHYLALVGGGAADSNHDGIPDFIADSNGDGVAQSTEIPWSGGNSGTIAVVSPTAGATLSGTAKICFNVGLDAPLLDSAYVLVDGNVAPVMTASRTPRGGPQEVELDTRYIEDGDHLISVAASVPIAAGSPMIVFSQPVSVHTSNPVRHPTWQSTAELAVRLSFKVPITLPNVSLSFFRKGYPKAADPFAPSTFAGSYDGVFSDGIVSFSEDPSLRGFQPGDSLYSFATLAPDGATPASQTATLPVQSFSEPYPCSGFWAAAYCDDNVDYIGSISTPVLDPSNNNPAGVPWRHVTDLGAWRGVGDFADDGMCEATGGTIVVPPGTSLLDGQTWPMRVAAYEKVFFKYDAHLLLRILSNPKVRNFYGSGHGNNNGFLGLWAFEIQAGVAGRYRFVYLDGCQTFGHPLFSAFGAAIEETTAPGSTDISWYHQNIRPGAFMGNIVDVPGAYPIDPPVVIGGVSYSWRTYERLAQWHSQFLASWIDLSRPLSDAKDYADYYWDRTGLPEDTGEVGKNPDGTSIIYDIRVHLKIAGYHNLLFNGYNHDFDTW